MKLAFAASIIAAAASLCAPAAAASTATAGAKAADAQPRIYCAKVEIVSRIPKKICLSEEGWLNQGVTLKKA